MCGSARNVVCRHHRRSCDHVLAERGSGALPCSRPSSLWCSGNYGGSQETEVWVLLGVKLYAHQKSSLMIRRDRQLSLASLQALRERRGRDGAEWSFRKTDVASLCRSVGGGGLFLAQRDRGEAPGCFVRSMSLSRVRGQSLVDHADVMQDLCFCTLRTAPPFLNSHEGSWPGSLQDFGVVSPETRGREEGTASLLG